MIFDVDLELEEEDHSQCQSLFLIFVLGSFAALLYQLVVEKAGPEL
jgi:hypothetical protein